MKNEDKVRVAAYYMWVNEGCPHGKDQEHWMRAMEMTGTSGRSARESKMATKSTAKKAASAVMKAKPAARMAAKSVSSKASSAKKSMKRK